MISGKKLKKLCKAMKSLEDMGMNITDIAVSFETLLELRDCGINTKNNMWIGKDVIGKSFLKNKGKDFKGMMFGIRFHSM